jgi:chromosome segregation ATPase
MEEVDGRDSVHFLLPSDPVEKMSAGHEIHNGERVILRTRSTKIIPPRRERMSVKAMREMSTEVSADDFHALEEKVYRTIELLKAAREAKAAAERDASRLREQLETREEEFETLRSEMVGLRREREEVRTRVEKMLRQIDELTDEGSAG